MEGTFIVGDARFLPFRSSSFDVVFSYSVLQHFGREDLLKTLVETERVLRASGIAKIQMANALGLRSVYHQARRGFRAATGFEVRYWTPRGLRLAFEGAIGPTELEVDGYFSLNAQSGDAHLLPGVFRGVVRASQVCRTVSDTVWLLRYLADSLYVIAKKRGGAAKMCDVGGSND
jgi:SAM-dependent methyltransferase